MTNWNNPECLDVVEIIRRSEQGVTLPFFCRVSDGRQFWVKGAGAGRRALCCEWLAGSLAQKLDLPVPPIALLRVDERLIRQSARSDILDLGAGIVFGSHHVEDAQEYSFDDAKALMRKQPELARMILLFDWWIQNEDRTLGERGGNPNLMVGTADSRTIIIDHNIAFDPSWKSTHFFDHHAFASTKKGGDPQWLLELREKMVQLLTEIDGLWGQLPEEWLHYDQDARDPINISQDEIVGILNRVNTSWDAVWS